MVLRFRGVGRVPGPPAFPVPWTRQPEPQQRSQESQGRLGVPGSEFLPRAGVPSPWRLHRCAPQGPTGQALSASRRAPGSPPGVRGRVDPRSGPESQPLPAWGPRGVRRASGIPVPSDRERTPHGGLGGQAAGFLEGWRGTPRGSDSEKVSPPPRSLCPHQVLAETPAVPTSATGEERGDRDLRALPGGECSHGPSCWDPAPEVWAGPGLGAHGRGPLCSPGPGPQVYRRGMMTGDRGKGATAAHLLSRKHPST